MSRLCWPAWALFCGDRFDDETVFPFGVEGDRCPSFGFLHELTTGGLV